MLRIEFDTANLTEDEAQGLTALLSALHPPKGRAIQTVVEVPEKGFTPVHPVVSVVTIPGGETATEAFTPVNPALTMAVASGGVASGGGGGGTEARALTSEPGITRDSDGIPWDERIHSESRATNRDGTWRKRKNLDDGVYDRVMAELKAANTARTIGAAASLVPPTVTVTPPPPPVVVTPVVPATSDVPSFAQFMTAIGEAQRTGRLTADAFKAVIAAGGKASLTDYHADEAARGLAWLTFRATVPE